MYTMAYVELDGDRKPQFQPTNVSDLPHDAIEEMSLCLNPRLLMKDYRSLAGKMGLSHRQVKNIDTKSNPTEELLAIWQSGQGSKTVTDLILLLKKIERYDVIQFLSRHEFTVISDRPTSMASSGSDYKEPIEHDIGNSSEDEQRTVQRFNSYYTPVPYPASQISDPSTNSTLCPEEADTDDETNMSIMSGSNSNRTSSSLEGYLDGSSSRSRTSTNDRLDYPHRSNYGCMYQSSKPMTYQQSSPSHNMNDEYDDILEQKIRNQRALESEDSQLFHPNYQFRKREDSNASTSTAGSINTSTASTRVDTGIQTERVPVFSPTAGDLPPFLSPRGPLVATDKIALLIGNRFYKNLDDPLVFPHKDVFDLKNALLELGFKVLSLVDLTLREMRTIMLAYCQLLGPGVFAVFYYAGHGFEENGKNYLMPVDATTEKKEEEFIQAQEILTEMRLAKTALNLVIIDTCRVKGINVTNSKVIQRPDIGNTIIAYSCSSSMPAFEAHNQQNGVYMSELLPRIRQDRRIEYILMDVNEAVHGNPLVVQRPVFESDSIGDCRLTCKIDVTAHLNHWSQRFDKWYQANAPPPARIIVRDMENLDIRLTYDSLFSNMLQVNVAINNRNNAPYIVEDVNLLSTSNEMSIAKGDIFENGCASPEGGYTNIISFRITDLQKVTHEILLVLEIKAKLGDEDCNVEIKMNADFPLVSSFLQEFLTWITADKRAGTGSLKNTWV